VILSALDDPSAESEAGRALAMTPESADAYLVRARVRRRAGDRRAALADVESALALAPGDPRLLELRGVLKTEMGNPDGALIDLDRAILRGAQGTVRVARALALSALGRNEAARQDWSLALDYDPEDPQAYLGRAWALIRLGRPNRALVDLEQAAAWAGDHPRLLPRITAAYALCLGARPDRLPRWLGLAHRAWSSWIATARPGPGSARSVHTRGNPRVYRPGRVTIDFHSISEVGCTDAILSVHNPTAHERHCNLGNSPGSRDARLLVAEATRALHGTRRSSRVEEI
jgi:tetratricopeptide (TPR) repeat protein